ncbi:MAG: hypothetical protein E7641_02030 [Ruminococcaceae bacterium]|nr:hypothetical protein [Oscillospiraceae bacterium]
MKKILSLVLSLLIVIPMFAFGGYAAEPLDIRELEAKGQQHIYVGSKWAAQPPVLDGVIGEGEYQTSAEAKFKNAESYLSGAHHHISYDADYIYIGVKLDGDKAYKDGVCGYRVNLAFPTSGGFSDFYSRVEIGVFSDENGDMIPSVRFYDQYNGRAAYIFTLDSAVVADAVRGRDKTTRTTCYEIAIDKAVLQREAGVVMTERVLFFTTLINALGSYEYRLEIDSATAAGIAAAYPEHSQPQDSWVGHVIHFSDQPAESEKIDTVDGAAVKLVKDDVFSLRFKTTVDKSYLDGLVAEKGKDNVKVGILMAEKSFLEASGGVLTLEKAEEMGSEYSLVNIVSNVDNAYESTDDAYSFVGSVRGISDETGEYFAVGYVKAGDQVTYASHVSERTVAGVAYAALRDISKSKAEGYGQTLKVANNKEAPSTALAAYTLNTPYAEAEQNALYRMASGFNLSILPYFRDIVARQEGDIRVATSNVYFHHFRVVYPNATEAEKQAAVDNHVKSMMEIDADVLCLQEVSDKMYGSYDYKYQTRLNPRLRQKGYTEAAATVGEFPAGSTSSNLVGVNYTPIWYRANVLTLEACEHVFYTSVGYNPDGGLSSSKSFTWALFTEKATGKQFIAISTHMTWAGDAVVSNILRKLDASEVMMKVSELEKKYNVPIMVMGDFNSDPTTDPYKVMLGGNLVNAKTVAKDVINGAYATYHTFPTLSNKTAGRYTPLLGKAIDHIFVSREGLNIKNYQTLISDNIISSSDHIPLSIDFTIN